MTARTFLRQLILTFAVRADQPELVRAQVLALSRQIPWLYLLLFANTLAVAYTHYGTAPDWMTVYSVAFLGLLCLWRAIDWYRARNSIADLEKSIGHLRRIRLLAIVVSTLFAAWAIALFGYGDPYQQGHVAFFISLTVVGCIFCLVYFPPAALLVVVIVLGSFVVYFGMSDNQVYVAIAANMAMVSVMVIQIIRTYYAAFSGLIESRRDLELQHRRTVELSDQNHALAFQDALTGLANRRAFFTRLDEVIALASDQDCFAIAMIDLDGFKPVNDVYGHPAGDAVLMQAGQRLREILGPDVLIARLGGDEFGVILPCETIEARLDPAPATPSGSTRPSGPAPHDDVQLRAGLIALGQQLCTGLNDPFEVTGGAVQLAASLGFATYPAAAKTANDLFERADFALYFAKKNMPGQPVIFARDHETLIRHGSEIEQALRLADLETELAIHFQPVFDLRNRRLHSLEALARWTSPRIGAIPPDTFFEVAERTGMVGTITGVLFCKALRAMADWPGDAALSFNLSAHDLVMHDMAQWLIDQINEHGIHPGRLTFEVTETALLRDFASARACIRFLRGHGARVALDDFGIGYSSLRYVHELEFDCLKIDRSFVHPIVTNDRSRRVVRTMINMCDTLGADCVVEGVETAEQCQQVLALGAYLAQGYLFARPAPEIDWAAFPALLDKALSPDTCKIG